MASHPTGQPQTLPPVYAWNWPDKYLGPIIALYIILLTIIILVAVLLIFRGIRTFGIRKCSLNPMIWATILTILAAVGFEGISLYIDANDVASDINKPIFGTLEYVSFTTFAGWFILVYIVMIVRIRFAFEDNPQYSVSKKALIQLIIPGVVCAASMIIFAGFSSTIANRETRITLVVLMALSEIIFNTLLLRLFLTRLYRMTQNLDDTLESLMIQMAAIELDTNTSTSVTSGENTPKPESQQNNSGNNTNDDMRDLGDLNDLGDLGRSGTPMSDMNKSLSAVSVESIKSDMIRTRSDQSEIVDTMIQISLLTIISVFVQQLWLWFWIFMYFIGYEQFQFKNGWWIQAMIMLICKHVAVATNCVALYLSFPFNTNHYNVLCCCCHKWLRSCCVKYISLRQMRRAMSKR